MGSAPESWKKAEWIREELVMNLGEWESRVSARCVNSARFHFSRILVWLAWSLQGFITSSWLQICHIRSTECSKIFYKKKIRSTGPQVCRGSMVVSWIFQYFMDMVSTILRTHSFQLFSAYNHQKLLRTTKRSVFQLAFIKIDSVKTIQNQHIHIINRVFALVGIYYFLDLEPYRHRHLLPHEIYTILSTSRFIHN